MRAKADEQLNRIYMGLGGALQKQIEDLRAAGKEQEAKRVATAFAKFIDRIGAQQGSANWATRVWLAQTYLRDGEPSIGRPRSRGRRTADRRGNVARVLYQIAGRLPAIDEGRCQQSEAAAERTMPCWRPRCNSASVTGPSDNSTKALDTFSEILKQKESSLAVQRAAAMTYAERGQHETCEVV